MIKNPSMGLWIDAESEFSPVRGLYGNPCLDTEIEKKHREKHEHYKVYRFRKLKGWRKK